jgi:hypothetical protein
MQNINFATGNQNRTIMKLLDFSKTFQDEESCEKYLREAREQSGLVCSKCGNNGHYWDKYNKRWICKKCSHETTLTSGTVMHGSKLPLMYWFSAIHLLTSTRNSFSAKEMQRQLGHKRYQPIWEMMHKLRSVMGIRDSKYKLTKEIEMDEAFFTTDSQEYQTDKEAGKPLKRGAGSQRKSKVLVMVESEASVPKKKSHKDRKAGHIRMVHIPDLLSETVKCEAAKAINNESSIIMDASKSHAKLGDEFNVVDKKVVKPEDAPKVLPWVHIAISNAKSMFLNLYHGIKDEYLQSYLNEFCYKFNRKYFDDRLFDRLMVASLAYTPTFKHRIYNKNASDCCG